AVDLDGGDTATSYQPLVEALRNPETKDEAIETLVEVSRGVLETIRGKKSGGAALKAVTAANTRLTEVDLGRADKSTYSAIERQLDQIEKRGAELKAVLAKLRE